MEDQIYGMFEAQMKAFMEQTTLPGMSFAFFNKDGLLYGKGLGLKNVENNAPADLNTAGMIGSVSKTFCALATWICIERGLIGLHDPVDKYLPVTFMKEGNPITIHHLLSQTSGISDLGLALQHILIPLDNPFGEPIPDYLVNTNEEYLHYLNNSGEFVQKPGGYCYCNSNFTILSLIIEKVSGISYSQFIKNNIFLPLDMHNSSFLYDGAENHYTPYFLSLGDDGNYTPKKLPYQNHTLLYGAGGVVSSVNDMVHYGMMLTNYGVFKDKQILSPEHLKLMFTKVQECDEINELGAEGIGVTNGGYGYGWFVTDFFGERVVLHLGEVLVASSFLMLLPDRNFGLVQIDNTGDIAMTELETGLAAMAMYLGKNPVTDFPLMAAGAHLEQLVGDYKGYKGFGTATISMQGSTLYLHDMWNKSPEPLHPTSLDLFCTEFYLKTSPAGRGDIRFDIKSDGSIYMRYSKLYLKKQ